MKYIMLLISFFAVLSFTGCENDNNSVNGPVSLEKAGTGYSDPNTFDADGNLCVIGGDYNTQTIGTPMELWMGVGNETAGTLVGYVTFLTGPDRVKIDLTDVDGNPGPDFFPYVVQTAHIHFGETVNDIPRSRKGNPIPGQFEYNVPVDPYQSVYEIEVEFEAVGAIHLSVVKYGGIEGFNFYLPNNQVTLTAFDFANPTYFKIAVEDGGFISEYDMGYGPGIYEGYCVDLDNLISLGTQYPAYLYSSYEELPEWMTGPGKIEYPENFDKINYLVNHYTYGTFVQPQDAICGADVRTPEALTYGDIQRAIWHYIDDSQGNPGTYNQERINAILCDVDANGEGFVPGCDEKIVFLVVPTGTNEDYTVQIVIGQTVIGQIEVPCETSGGTAWGDGKFGANFPGAKQWGTYFNYDAFCVPTI